ncbi:MAG: hypothetical protein WCD79_19460 [Chthoniobacteraceae bacterium]
MKTNGIYFKCWFSFATIGLAGVLFISKLGGAEASAEQKQPSPASVDARLIIQKTQYRFQPFCFIGDQFPKGEFADPVAVAVFFGNYTIDVTFYDEAFNAVSTADKPGRYGSVVEIHTERSGIIKRFCTLYRIPQQSDWPPAVLPMSADLLGELGINPVVAEEQKGVLEGYLKGRVGEKFLNSPESALILAWLRTTLPGTRTTRRNDPWMVNMRWIHELKRKTGNLVPLEYLVQLPVGFEKSSRKKWPTILYLHGSGGKDLSMEEVGNLSLPGYARAHKKKFPFILITPHCPKDSGWEVPALDDLWAEVVRKYPVDPDRVYLTGESLGGGACWTLAIEHPDRFAAMAPVSGGGGGEGLDMDRIKDLPVWDFHGLVDYDVLIQRSYDRVEALRKLGGRVRFTVYADGEHNIWDDVYSRGELYTWLLGQVRGRPAQPRATVQGTEPSDQRELKVPLNLHGYGDS